VDRWGNRVLLFFEGTSCECRQTSVSSATFAPSSVAVVCTSNVSSVICRCRLRVERFELRPWLVCASNVSSVICRCRLRVERFDLVCALRLVCGTSGHRRVCVSASDWPAVCLVSDISISIYWYYVLFCSSEKYMLGHDKEPSLEKIEHILKYNCYCYIVK